MGVGAGAGAGADAVQFVGALRVNPRSGGGGGGGSGGSGGGGGGGERSGQRRGVQHGFSFVSQLVGRCERGFGRSRINSAGAGIAQSVACWARRPA